MVVGFGVLGARSEPTVNFPGFRHVDTTTLANSALPTIPVKLLADEDFAPWSFKGADGKLTGISVELALAACAEAALNCTVEAKPFEALLPALRKGEAQLIISGLRPDAQLLQEFVITRPYFRSLARFVVREGSPLSTPDVRTLAGKRLGVVKNSSHHRFLETYYGRSALTPFATALEMQDALRTGQIDVAFGDAVAMSFWLAGSDARRCCAYLGKAFLHRETFSRSLVFVGGKNQNAIVQAFDVSLDQLESQAATAEIFARYLPSSIW
jgi:polar amino acid transport system substrate-binding protein